MSEPLSHEGTGLPAHPDRVDAAAPTSQGNGWGLILVAVLLGALLVLIVVLHLTGVVGPGAH